MNTVYFILVAVGFLYLLYRASEWAAESRFQRQISRKSKDLDREDQAKMRRAWCEYPSEFRRAQDGRDV